MAPIAPTAATLFYDHLFSVAPEVRPLFPDDIIEQQHKLMQMGATFAPRWRPRRRLVRARGVVQALYAVRPTRTVNVPEAPSP